MLCHTRPSTPVKFAQTGESFAREENCSSGRRDKPRHARPKRFIRVYRVHKSVSSLDRPLCTAVRDDGHRRGGGGTQLTAAAARRSHSPPPPLSPRAALPCDVYMDRPDQNVRRSNLTLPPPRPAKRTLRTRSRRLQPSIFPPTTDRTNFQGERGASSTLPLGPPLPPSCLDSWRCALFYRRQPVLRGWGASLGGRNGRALGPSTRATPGAVRHSRAPGRGRVTPVSPALL